MSQHDPRDTLVVLRMCHGGPGFSTISPLGRLWHEVKPLLVPKQAAFFHKTRGMCWMLDRNR